MKTYKLNPKLIMTEAEISGLDSLPDNLPDNKLTKKQIQFVYDLYYKYIMHKITVGWGTELFEIEKREKWPSGPRVKNHEAMRMILNTLVELNKHRKSMDNKEAASFFYNMLTCRGTHNRLVQYAYRD